MSRPLRLAPKKTSVVQTPERAAPSEPSWPSFPGGAQYVGTSADGRTVVWVDPKLGAQALQNATDLVNDADRVSALNDNFFGTPGGDVQVVLFALNGPTDGTGGADHMGCSFSDGQNIEVDVSYGNSMRCSALFEAELSECSMNGQLCGLSTGEALSRWCSMLVSSNALGDFASAPTWVEDGMPDFVNSVDPTDQNYDSIGCGMAFLSWLQSLGHALPLIAQNMVQGGDKQTLAQLYANLTGDSASNALPKFTAALNALPGGVNSDDPFNEAQPVPAPPPPPGPPAPPPVPPAPPGTAVSLDQAIAWGTQGILQGDPLQRQTDAVTNMTAGLKAGWPQ
jgi:hypothetical protein